MIISLGALPPTRVGNGYEETNSMAMTQPAPLYPDDASVNMSEMSKQLRHITSQIEQMQLYQRVHSERVQTLELDVQVLKGTNHNGADTDNGGITETVADRRSEATIATHASGKSDVKVIWEQSHHHTLRESVWEMAIVINVGILSWSASFQFVCAFLLNLFLQGVICSSMIFSFGSERIDIESIVQWRRIVGHNYKEADSITEQSLVSRICAVDDTLGTFDVFKTMLEDYDHYVTTGFGEWLAAVVVLVWILTVTEDFLACISFADGICSLPTARHTQVMSTWNPAFRLVTFEFVKMGMRHRAFLLFLALMRITMTFLLLVPGCIWLANEYEINEMLLNCCALGFVFELDEMCFDIVAPLDMQTLAENIRPLPKIRNERWDTLLLPKIPPLLSGTLIFFYMLFMHIIPTKEYLIDIHHSLCAGNQDFVYGLNVDTKLIYTVRTTSADEATLERKESLVVKDLVQMANMTQVTGALHMDNFASLRARSEVSMASFTDERMLRCEDLLHVYPKAVLGAVQRYNANPSETTCEGLSASCFEIEQKLLRLVCPVTCGAASPRSGMLLDRREYGVKGEMCFASQTYQDAFALIPCSDPSPDALMALPGWKKAWKLMVEYWGRFSSDFRKCSQTIADEFLSQGCDALALYQDASCMGFNAQELCTDFTDLIDLARFCPVACGCLGGVRSNHSACPPSCAR